MYNRMGSTLNSFKCLLYYVFSCLSKDLNCNVRRNHITFDKGTQEIIFSLRCCGEPNFDLFKSHFYKKFKEFQQLEEADLLLHVHRRYKRLIAITQVDGAPDGRCIHVIFMYPVVGTFRRHKISSFIFLIVLHIIISPL